MYRTSSATCHDAAMIYSPKDNPAGRLQFIIVVFSSVISHGGVFCGLSDSAVMLY